MIVIFQKYCEVTIIFEWILQFDIVHGRYFISVTHYLVLIFLWTVCQNIENIGITIHHYFPCNEFQATAKNCHFLRYIHLSM